MLSTRNNHGISNPASPYSGVHRPLIRDHVHRSTKLPSFDLFHDLCGGQGKRFLAPTISITTSTHCCPVPYPAIPSSTVTQVARPTRNRKGLPRPSASFPLKQHTRATAGTVLPEALTCSLTKPQAFGRDLLPFAAPGPLVEGLASSAAAAPQGLASEAKGTPD